ncbi:MAG: hypothetical protein RL701_2208, partial [Pseudomonadota bacterium]
MDTALLALSNAKPVANPVPTGMIDQDDIDTRGALEVGGVSARSAAMRQTLGVLSRLAHTDMTVALLGETGTGKEVLAQALHHASARAREVFVALDCGAMVTNLAESELLGHERGAFAGAVTQYIGAFERAAGGTLFIDEVGELSLELQARLLRVLESKRVRRL